MEHHRPSRTYLEQLRKRYAKAGRTARRRMLDEFVQTTGYQRKYAIALLRGKRQWRAPQQPIRRPRQRIYTAEDQRAVRQLAAWFDQIGSKRLRAALDAELPRLRRRGHLRVSATGYKHLQRISPASMDRLRQHDPQRAIRPHGGTKPGTLLKSQIPVRTFAQWDDKRPGFMELDLVQHDGGNASGFFACTLTMTDVSTGWTELRAVQTKAQVFVFDAIQFIRRQLPVQLLGIDSDNGGEFINDQLRRYCETEHITFTRGRVGRKNDNAYVEQKNWSVTRKLLGYDRYDTVAQVARMNRIYALYGVYINHFLPVMKLTGKERVGARVRRIFDAPRTPYQRLLDAQGLTPTEARRLRAQHDDLDVVTLHQQITTLLEQLVPSRRK